jgi:hypothetical protein
VQRREPAEVAGDLGLDRGQQRAIRNRAPGGAARAAGPPDPGRPAMTAAVPDTAGGPAPDPTPRVLARRLAPLLVGMGLQGMILWVPVEKLFMSEIGYPRVGRGDGAGLRGGGAVLEVPSGVLADRRSAAGSWCWRVSR